MLNYLSTDARLVTVLTRPELVQRLGAMLNYFLSRLVGKAGLELKVEQPEKYHFDARKLLRELGQIYVHLGGVAQFAAAIVSDGRCYSHELMRKATIKVRQTNLNSNPNP